MASDGESLAGSRSRREKKDKGGRLAALHKLKELKGTKNKYSVDSVSDVWEEVDEREYSKRVRDRQDDDWIVDDDGGGYVEDGREIFDDDIIQDTPNLKRGKQESKRSKAEGIEGSKSSDIKRMFQAMPVKKKKAESSVKLEEDSTLAAILNDLRNQPVVDVKPITPTVFKKKKKSFATPTSFITPVNTISKTPTRLRSNHLICPRSISSSMTSPSSPKSNGESNFRAKHVKIKSERFLPPQSPFETEPPEDFPEEMDFEDGELNAQIQSANNYQQAPAMKIEMDFGEEFDDDGLTDSMLVSQLDSSLPLVAEVSAKPKHSVEMPLKNKMSYDEEVLTALEKNIDHDLLDAPAHEVLTVQPPAIACDNLPIQKNENGEDVIHFFWMDSHEDFLKQPGTVYLFGKIKAQSSDSFVSTCLVVKNIERQVFILPREKRLNKKSNELTDEQVTMNDVYSEVDKLIARKFKIQEFKTKVSTKSYAFGKQDVPFESEYLEVKYSAAYPALPSDFSGETFSHVFGTTTTSLETLLISRKIMGPCWLEIKTPEASSPPVSWCKLEVLVSRMESITPIRNPPASPPVIVFSLAVQTVINSKSRQAEIISIVGLSHDKYFLDKGSPKPFYQTQFCIVAKPNDTIFPFDFREKVARKRNKVDLAENERALISLAITKIYKLDPDIIVGHDIVSFDLDLLLQRVATNKVSNWSRLGRLRRSLMPQQTGSGRIMQAMSGRLMCDIKLSAKEFIHCKSYDLTELSEVVLGKTHVTVTPEQAKLAFNNSQQLLSLIHHNLKTSLVNLEILSELNVLPLATHITNIAGNTLCRTLIGGRSERNEYLLLHAFNDKNFVVPDKLTKKSMKHQQEQQSVMPDADDTELREEASKKSGRRKPAYAGGLVLEPKKGFYDTFVLLMDFNSLYPSIIQEYNICFTTVSAPPEVTSEEEIDQLDFDLPDRDLELGILPIEIRKLVQSRRQVKSLLQAPNLAPELKLQYEIRQKALKLMANSMYGCLGFSNARFYAKHLAAMVTGLGRKILIQTKEMVEKQMNLEVIYGDTDSLMINTNCSDYESVLKTGTKIKAEVNKLYRCLEIDTDAVFKSVLLLKKKKYAALKISRGVGGSLDTCSEIKGLDVVRRDWAQLACEVGRFVLDELLSDKQREDKINSIISNLESVAAKMRQGEISHDKLAITKQLTKNPEEYADKKGLPHVNVALRLNSKGGKRLRQGDAVHYIICQDGSTLTATQRAYHVEELKVNENLKIDIDYYLTNQIHPVVARICNPIEELDAIRIANCLGLDSSAYKAKTIVSGVSGSDGRILGDWSQMTDEERYKDCERIKIVCPICKKEKVVDGIFSGADLETKVTIAQCTDPQCTVLNSALYFLIYQTLVEKIRGFVQQYYRNWLLCDMAGCGHRSFSIPLSFGSGKLRCPTCSDGRLQSEYNAGLLHTQLSYYRYLFDFGKAIAAFPPTHKAYVEDLLTNDDRRHLSVLLRTVDNYISSNAYNFVDLGVIFRPLQTMLAATSHARVL